MNKTLVVACLAAGSAVAFAWPQDLALQSAPKAASGGRNGRIYCNIPRQSLKTYAQVCTDLVEARVLNIEHVVPETGVAHRRVTLEVARSLKEQQPSQIGICVAGASNERGTVVADRAPELTIGDELVLFLWREQGTESAGILGLADGTYRVSGEDATRTVTGLHARGESIEAFFARAAELWIE